MMIVNLNKKPIMFFLCFYSCLLCMEENKYDFIQESLDKDAKKYFLYLRANINHLSGDFKSSYSDFEKLISKESSPYAYDGFIRFLFTVNNFKQIINLYENKLKTSFSDNNEILNIIAQSFTNLNQPQKAELILSELSKKYPNDVQAAYFRAINLIQSNDLNAALKFINSCIQNPNLKSKLFLFYFLGSKVFLKMNKYEEAIEYSERSTQINPNYPRPYLFKGLLYEQLGKTKLAIKGYKSFLETSNPNNSDAEILQVEKMLIRLLRLEKRFGEVVDILEKLGVKTPTYKFDLAFSLWQAGKVQEALTKIDEFLEDNPQVQPAKLLKIELLISLRKKDELLNFIKDWLNQEPENFTALRTLFIIRSIGVSNSEITNIIELACTTKPENINLNSALIDLYLEQKNYKKAIAYCKKLFNLTNDTEVKSKILFQSAYVHFITGNKSKVEKILKISLGYKPSYPSSYNLLAYFYAKNNKSLDEALNYINIALEKIPNCYYYLDTKGYILFKQGKVADSIEFFKKALELNPYDAKIKKHLNLALSFGK